MDLIRLVDGEVPAYPVWITEERIDWVLLDNVVEVRRPDLLTEVARHNDLGLEEQLQFWARVLRDVAGDFLEGGFGSLDEAGTLIRGRVAATPQEVRISIPSDAPDGAGARSAAAVRAIVPANVAVSIHRYRRGSSAGSDRD